nr:patatin-like phospholipase family protein [Variovorax boronicumulans]
MHAPSEPSPRRGPADPCLQLALQGGGAHGAFTWGVLDRLLDEPRIGLGDVSGTSAGALNGAALVSGLRCGGRQEASRRLEQLWTELALVGAPLSWLLTPLRKPGLGVWDDAAPLLSPYQSNPFAMAPLHAVLARVVDVAALNAPGPVRLHVNALNLRTGEGRVFGPGALSVQALLASACAPLMFQAIEIDGESYWDGSYASNPALAPLYEDRRQADLLLVELAPLERPEVPTTAKNILNRINEIASMRGLREELRALQQADSRRGGGALRLHAIRLADSVPPAQAEPSVKRTVGMELFRALHAQGAAACEAWLRSHAGAVGRRSSVDLAACYFAASA